MNDRIRENDVSAPPGQPVPPACPARGPVPQSLLPGSTHLLAELGKAEDRGGSGRRRVALETHSPLLFLYGLKGAGSCPEDADETALSCHSPLSPTLLVISPHHSS